MTNLLPAGRRRSASLTVICLPVVVVFGWLMIHRLASCPKGIQADFVQEWTSARNFWTGSPIYLPLTESFPKYFGPQARTELHVNAHPPVAVLIALPFGLCDYHTGWLVWNIASLALLGVSLWLLMRPAGLGYSPSSAVPLAALLLASNPLAQQVIEGQMNLVIFGLIVGAWAADRQQRPWLAGSLVGLAAAIKLYPAFLLVYFVARRQWRATALCGLSFLAASLLAAAVLGPEIFAVYARDVMPAFAHYGNNLANASLAGIWSKLFVGMPGLSAPLIAAPTAAKIANVISALVLAAICGGKAWQADDRASADVAFAACVLGMLLASPITWGHSFVLLVLPLLIMWRHGGALCRGLVAASMALQWLIRPGWIWNSLIPGFQAFTLGMAPPGYQVPPAYVLTALSYMTFGLVALFVIALTLRTSRAQASVYRS